VIKVNRLEKLIGVNGSLGCVTYKLCTFQMYIPNITQEECSNNKGKIMSVCIAPTTMFEVLFAYCGFMGGGGCNTLLTEIANLRDHM